MTYFLLQSLCCLSAIFVMFVLTYIIGFFILTGIDFKNIREIKNIIHPDIDDIFFNLLSGSIALWTLMAIWSTGGNSISLINLFPACALVILRKQQKKFSKYLPKICISYKNYKILFVWLGICFIWYILAWIPVLNWNSGFIVCRGADFRDWATTVTSLNDGWENRYGFANYFEKQITPPYHYAELWLAAFVTKFLFIPMQLSCDIVILTFLASIFHLGLFAWSKEFKMNLRSICIFFLPFFAPISIYTLIVTKILNINTVTTSSFFWSRWLVSKDLFPLCIILASAILISNRKIVTAIILLLFIPGMDICWAPSAYAGVASGFFVLTFLSSEKKIYKRIKKYKEIIITGFLSFIFLILFYYKYANEAKKWMESMTVTDISIWGRLFFHPIECFVIVLCIFLFFHMVKSQFSVCRYEFFWIRVIGGGILAGGVLVYALIYKSFDAPQFLKLYILLNLSFWLACSRITKLAEKKLLCTIFLTVFFLYILFFISRMCARGTWRYRNLNEQDSYITYYNKLLHYAFSLVPKGRCLIIGTFFDPDKDMGLLNLYPEREFPFPLGGYFRAYHYVNLTQNKMGKDDIHNAFSIYYRNQKKINNRDMLLPEFVLKYVDFVETWGNVSLPHSLKPYLQLLCEDPSTGCRLYEIKFSPVSILHK